MSSHQHRGAYGTVRFDAEVLQRRRRRDCQQHVPNDTVFKSGSYALRGLSHKRQIRIKLEPCSIESQASAGRCCLTQQLRRFA